MAEMNRLGLRTANTDDIISNIITQDTAGGGRRFVSEGLRPRAPSAPAGPMGADLDPMVTGGVPRSTQMRTPEAGLGGRSRDEYVARSPGGRRDEFGADLDPMVSGGVPRSAAMRTPDPSTIPQMGMQGPPTANQARAQDIYADSDAMWRGATESLPGIPGAGLIQRAADYGAGLGQSMAPGALDAAGAVASAMGATGVGANAFDAAAALREPRPGMDSGAGLQGVPPMPPTGDAAAATPVPDAAPQAAPQQGLTTTQAPRAMPVAGGGQAGLTGPAPAQVDPRSPEAFNPETGERDPVSRAASVFERMFGEEGSDRRDNMSRALMLAGAAIMGASHQGIGPALGAGIQAGVMSYDQAQQALVEEERYARDMGMREEAHALNMELQRLRIERARQGGGSGSLSSRQSPVSLANTDYLDLLSTFSGDPNITLTPQQAFEAALRRNRFIVPDDDDGLF